MTSARLYALQTWYVAGKDSAGVNKDDNSVLARTASNGGLTRTQGRTAASLVFL